VIREQGYAGWIDRIACDLDAQLEYGCRHLKKKIQSWGLAEGILAYNAGTPRRNGSGLYANQYYFDKVMLHAKSWKE
jgi:hypothetical protein